MSNHPFFFTWTDQRNAEPMAMERGQGVYFWTADGSRWLDLASMSYQAHLGHGHGGVIDAIKRQAESMCLTTANAVFPAKVELAERLLALAPKGFSKVLFTLGGAESVENAIKIARMVTGRYKLVSRYRSYHGASMGAISLSGDWRRPPVEPGLVGAVHAMDCYCDRCPFGKTVDSCNRECAIHIGDVLDLEGPRSVAAVVLEPVVGANGVLIPPPEYWPMVRRACDRHGTLLIADEVFTGFGRTGRCFAFEHFDVVPDMIALAKGLTAGYAPLGAVLVHERVAAHFEEHVLACGLTNYAHPLGCAAGVAALDAYEREGLFARARDLEPVLLGALGELQARFPIRFVRGKGLLAAIEIEAPAAFWPALSLALDDKKIFLHAYPRRGTVVFSPPLCIDEATLRHGMELFAEALGHAMPAASPADVLAARTQIAHRSPS